MTLNSEYNADDDEAYPWIEFINKSGSEEFLSNYFLSDDSTDVFKWQLPNVFLAAGDLDLIWFSGHGNSNHAENQLPPNLLYLVLTDSSGTIVDRVSLPMQVMNESYGRRFGYFDEWIYFSDEAYITPGYENTNPGPWLKIQASAEFPVGDAGYIGSLSFQDKMWILDYETLEENGTWTNLNVVWNSEDGINWQLINHAPPYQHGAMVTVFDGYMWAIDGNVYRSVDGIEWDMMSPSAPRGERIAVFQNALWILDGQSLFKSIDGILWEEVLEQTPWEYRQWPAFLAHNNKLWMYGGNINYNTGFDYYFTDVWSSEDGLNWETVTASSPWRGNFWFTYLSFDNRLWMIDGGWNYYDKDGPYNGNNNEVWSSLDGVNWELMNSPNVWAARHAPFTWLFNDHIWLGAGYRGGGHDRLLNDIWVYKRKSQSIQTNDIELTYGDSISIDFNVSSNLEVVIEAADTSVVDISTEAIVIPKSAGSTIAKLSNPGNEEYRAIEETIYVVVHKRDLLVKLPSYTVPFGENIPLPELTYEGFVFNDNVESIEVPPYIIGLPSLYSPKGNYILSAAGGISNNYNFTYGEGHLEILPSNSHFIFYPNPVSDRLTIFVDEDLPDNTQIEIFNRSGQPIIGAQVSSVGNSLQMDLTEFNPGIYILRIAAQGRTEVKKIVKN